MKLIVKKTDSLKGTIQIPGSKSHSVRALLFATLAEMQTGEKSNFMNLLESADTIAAKKACANLLANKSEIHTGNSGITTRFILPLLGLRKNPGQEITLDVNEQMRARPMTSLIDALNKLGMQIGQANSKAVGPTKKTLRSNNQSFPLRISGQLLGGEAEVDGETSQYISALLMSLPAAKNDSIITVPNLKERGYMEMMLSWLDFYGIRYEHVRGKNVDTFRIPGGQTYIAKDRVIPGDFSSASYPLAAAALLPGEVHLKGLDMNDSQGDKAMVQILQNMGADITIKGTTLTCKSWAGPKAQPVKPRIIDCNLIPDMLPTLAIVATQEEGETHLTNVAHARIKETDRIHSMAEGLRAMGADVEEKEDGLIIKKSTLHGAHIHGYDDHRTIMAFALAGMLADGETVIDTAEGISKTFPTFVELMRSLGANMETKQDHIILMGFKNIGKTTLGKGLAESTARKFIDLDDEIEKLHDGPQNYREIMRQHGEEYFRELETKALKKVLSAEPSIISLGGSTPLFENNQALIKHEICIHITGNLEEILKRIEKGGWPAFVDENDPKAHLRKLWDERKPVYESLAKITIKSQASKEKTLKLTKQELAKSLPVNLIIGHPLDHTWTPKLHNTAYQNLGIPNLMITYPCENVEEILEIPAQMMAVTMPHKQAIMPHLDEIDPQAKEIGAVNTVIGRKGYNTDIDGIAYAFRNTKIKDQNVLLIGAGGAAKTAAYFITKNGGNIFCMNRDRKEAEDLIAQFGGQIVEDTKNLEFQVAINATPLGMGELAEKTPLEKSELRPYHTVLDMIYNPHETKLLRLTREAGGTAISGLDMFVAQGLKQIELFTGRPIAKRLAPHNLYIKKLTT